VYRGGEGEGSTCGCVGACVCMYVCMNVHSSVYDAKTTNDCSKYHVDIK